MNKKALPCEGFFAIMTTVLKTFHNLLAKPIYAQTQDWEKINPSCVAGFGNDVATIQGIMCLLANVLSVALTIIGIAGFIMLVVASLQWMLSGGNSQSVESARNSMIFAVVGLLLALSSFMIINIIAQFTGLSIIESFNIPDSSFNWF